MDALGIATLLTQGIAPPQGSSDIGFHTGQIVSWDESSGTNVVTVQGVNMSNLKALQGGIGILYQAGDVVGLIRFQTTYFVLGKVAAPGAGAANQIRSASVSTGLNVPLQSYGPIPGSPGPELDNVYIGSSCRALVIVSALINTNNTNANMSFQVTGASSIAPNTDRSAWLGSAPGATVSNGNNVSASCTKAVLLTAADGLNAGFSNFIAQYVITNAGGPGAAGTGAIFQSRSMTIIPF